MAHLTLHHFFDWRWFSFRTFTGWMVIIAHTFNALAAAAYLMLVVRRGALCTGLPQSFTVRKHVDGRENIQVEARCGATTCRSSGRKSASTLQQPCTSYTASSASPAAGSAGASPGMLLSTKFLVCPDAKGLTLHTCSWPGRSLAMLERFSNQTAAV